MKLSCPFCGPRDHGEFTYHGDANPVRPEPDGPGPAADTAPWCDYIFQRRNPRGPHFEIWQHTQGCRCFIVVERDTLTHEIKGAEPLTAFRARQAQTRGAGEATSLTQAAE